MRIFFRMIVNLCLLNVPSRIFTWLQNIRTQGNLEAWFSLLIIQMKKLKLRQDKLFVQGHLLVALKLESKYPEHQANRLSIVHLARPFYFLTTYFPIRLYKIHKTSWGVLFILLHSKWLIETHNSHQCNLSDWTGVFSPSWAERNKNESETQRVKETVQRYFLMVYALA